MIKKPVLFLLFILIALLLFAGCQSDEGSAPIDTSGEAEDETQADETESEVPQNFTLEFATFWPEGDFQVAEGHKKWAQNISDRVAAETPHTVIFNWHYAGALLGMTEIMGGVADGAADIGTTCPSYTPGVYDATEALELPGLPNDNALVASVTINEAYKQSEYLQNEYTNVKVMHFWATGPGDFMTNTPIRTMEDFQGLNLRAVGGSIPWVDALGANTVSFGMGASYENIETGVVDGLLAPTDVLEGFRLAEVTRYITKSPPSYNMTFVKVMNLDTWNALPPSIQRIIEEINEATVIEYGKLRTDYTLLGQEYGISQGMEVIELEPDEYYKWEAKAEPLLKNYIEHLNAAGLPGQEVMDLVFELAEKYSAEYGDYGH